AGPRPSRAWRSRDEICSPSAAARPSGRQKGVKMQQQLCRVLENAALTDAVWRMRLSADPAAVTAPGQFVNLNLPGLYLRRPISLCDWDDSSLTLVYKVVGKGTDAMTRIRPGHSLDTLVGLGNGYDLTKSGDAPLLIGGGVGIPPLY